VVTSGVMTSDTIHEDPRELDEARGSRRTEQVRIIGAERASDAVAQAATGEAAQPGAQAGRSVSDATDQVVESTDTTSSGAADEWGPEDWGEPAEPQLPHWTEAPTGEVPAVLSRGDETEEADPWASLPEPTWREERHDWEQEAPLAPALLAGIADAAPLISEADETERQPWSFDLGTAAAGLSPEDEDTGELDDLATGALFGAWAPDAEDAEDQEAFVDDEASEVDRIAGEKTGELQLPPPDVATAGPQRQHPRVPGEASGEALVVDEVGELDDAEEVGDVDEGDESVGDDAEGESGRERGPKRQREARPGPEHGRRGRLVPSGPWTRLGRRHGEHADATAVEADAAAAVSRATGAARPSPQSSAFPRGVGAGGAPGPARPAAASPARAGGAPGSIPRPVPVRHGTATAHAGEDTLSQRTGRNIPVAIASGLVIGGLALVAFHFGTVPSMVVVTAVLTLAAVEAYAAFRRAYRPATLLGLVAVAGLIVGTYDKPFVALPVVVILLVASTFLWHLVGVDRRADPVRSTAATVLVFCWVGVFGSFAALLLAPSIFPNRTGIAYLLGALIAAVAYDVGALLVGAWLGRHPLSAASPGKTWEGVVGGAVAAIVFSVAVVHLVHPWTLGEAAVLGVVVAVVSPIGDLCESLVKRHLGLKDMGRILPGHGGLLDRVDGLLFVLPATYYLVRAFGHG
jgi:CDP-diglyceride synthetase